MYPDVAQTTAARKSVVFKITMDVYAKTTEAKDDLRAFVWDFGQENNQTITLEDLEEYVIGAALHPAQVGCILSWWCLVKDFSVFFYLPVNFKFE